MIWNKNWLLVTSFNIIFLIIIVDNYSLELLNLNIALSTLTLINLISSTNNYILDKNNNSIALLEIYESIIEKLLNLKVARWSILV